MLQDDHARNASGYPGTATGAALSFADRPDRSAWVACFAREVMARNLHTTWEGEIFSKDASFSSRRGRCNNSPWLYGYDSSCHYRIQRARGLGIQRASRRKPMLSLAICHGRTRGRAKEVAVYFRRRKAETMRCQPSMKVSNFIAKGSDTKRRGWHCNTSGIASECSY